MLVILTEGLSPSGRGHLRRWLQEFRAGVFLGYASALVRDELWDFLADRFPETGVLQIWPAANEQKFLLRMRNYTAASMTDLDGLSFITIRDATWQEACEKFRLQMDPNQKDFR